MNQPAPLIRQPIAPPAHIAYAHKLGRGMLTFEQIDQLVLAINPAYVQQKQRNSYLSQHQARAEMNRIFGYLNWSSEVLSMDLEYEERMLATDSPRHPNFPKNGSAPVYWICAYKAKVQVTVRDLWGMPLATYSEYHIEENAPQPNRGEARALAATSVESYALRRALINMGDRFGLGLYNGGSQAAHGQYTQQLFSGQLFNWVNPSVPEDQRQIVNVAPKITHQNIQAEQAVADDVLPAWTPDQDQQPQAPQLQRQAPMQQAPQQHIPMDQPMSMQEAAQRQQEGRDAMRANQIADAQAGIAPQQQQQQQQQQAPQQQFQQAPMGAGQQPPQFDPNILAMAQGGFKVDGQ